MGDGGALFGGREGVYRVTDMDAVIRSCVEGLWASLVVQTVKNLPVMWETWVQSLDWEDPLEKEMDRREWLPTPGLLPGEFH